MAGRVRNKVRRRRSPFASEAYGAVKFTVGAPGGTVVTQIQLQDDNGNNITSRGSFDLYLSDAADGSALNVTAPSGAVAVGTNGFSIDIKGDKKTHWVITNATGRADLSITNVGAKTVYACVVMPDGSIIVSPAIVTA